MTSAGFTKVGLPEAVIGIIIAHLCHLLSVLLLFRLSKAICLDQSEMAADRFALLAAAFHVISPAGVFLSAPYAESAFALFNFSGFYAYTISRNELKRAQGGMKRSVAMVAAGCCFGLATTLRSNGLLSGSLFVWDAVESAWWVLTGYRITFALQRLCVTLAAGSVMALGTVVPQYLAYMEYCGNSAQDRRPWCSNWVPSIYAFVQNRYW